VFLFLLGAANGHAQGVQNEAERYQAIALAKNEALILDTKTGAVWKWFEGAPGAGGRPAGSGLRYEGTVVPGNAPGDLVARQGLTPPHSRHVLEGRRPHRPAGVVNVGRSKVGGGGELRSPAAAQV
jgi:hypothetical protein